MLTQEEAAEVRVTVRQGWGSGRSCGSGGVAQHAVAQVAGLPSLP